MNILQSKQKVTQKSTIVCRINFFVALLSTFVPGGTKCHKLIFSIFSISAVWRAKSCKHHTHGCSAWHYIIFSCIHHLWPPPPPLWPAPLMPCSSPLTCPPDLPPPLSPAPRTCPPGPVPPPTCPPSLTCHPYAPPHLTCPPPSDLSLSDLLPLSDLPPLTH